MSDLFDAQADAARKADASRADRMHPRTLEEFVGQDQILDEGKLLRRTVHHAPRVSSRRNCTIHAHLVLNHIPILGLLFGTVLLAHGKWRMQEEVQKASLALIAFAGVSALAVYLTVEAAASGCSTGSARR